VVIRIDAVIYHAPDYVHKSGKRGKVGCTQDIKQRKKFYAEIEQPVKLVVLEKLKNVTLKTAGDREWYWAGKFGYPKGFRYELVAGASAAGKKCAALGKSGYKHYTREQRLEYASRGGKIGGLSAVRSGQLARAQKRGARRGGVATAASPNFINKRTLTCPHCGHVGKAIGMFRWHMNNCRSRQWA
jgi:hypothetical protein